MIDLYWYKIKEVINVYDGDTITVIIDLGMSISIKETIRLYGINTPEIRGAERPDGLVSKEWLTQKISRNINNLYIRTYKDKSGKYGRLLGEIFVEGEEISLNEQLIQEGLAEYYLP